MGEYALYFLAGIIVILVGYNIYAVRKHGARERGAAKQSRRDAAGAPKM
jgi:hypothetical protein